MQIVIQIDRENEACYLGFASSAVDARSVTRSIRVTEDVTLDFDGENRLVGLDVMNASKVLGDEFWKVRIDSLIGVKEAAEIAGVQRSNFVRDWADRAGFPTAVCEIGSGRMWLRSQVEDYVARKRPERSGPSRTGGRPRR